jgi:hypothetical protein
MKYDYDEIIIDLESTGMTVAAMGAEMGLIVCVLVG